jgi:hypothetical protein
VPVVPAMPGALSSPLPSLHYRDGGRQLATEVFVPFFLGPATVLLWAHHFAAGVDPYDATAEAPHELVSFTGSFHGRTMGALALTYKVTCVHADVVPSRPLNPAVKRCLGSIEPRMCILCREHLGSRQDVLALLEWGPCAWLPIRDQVSHLHAK